MLPHTMADDIISRMKKDLFPTAIGDWGTALPLLIQVLLHGRTRAASFSRMEPICAVHFVLCLRNNEINLPSVDTWDFLLSWRKFSGFSAP